MATNQLKAVYYQSVQLTPEGLLDFNNEVFVFQDLPFAELHDLFQQFNDYLVGKGEPMYIEEMNVETIGNLEPEVWVRFVDQRDERFFCYIFLNRSEYEEYREYVVKRSLMATLRANPSFFSAVGKALTQKKAASA